MAWDDVMVPITRVMLNDIPATTYTDDTVGKLILTAARMVAMELKFDFAFKADVDGGSISPDPTDDATLDDNFINLVCVKAACIADRGGAIKAASQAILVQDGTSKVDLREQFKAYQALLKNGWCSAYEQLREDYTTGQNEVGIGGAVVGRLRQLAGFPVRGMVFETDDSPDFWGGR